MLVYPASRGKGTRIFEDSEDLQLVEATPFENGVVLLCYDIEKTDRFRGSSEGVTIT